MAQREDSYPEWPNLAAMLFGRAAQWPDRTMLRWFAAGAWHAMTWAAFADRTARAAAGLRAAGIAAGDRVVIVSENRPEVLIAEAALMAIRAVPVPTYTVNTVADHAHILHDSGARVAITSTAAHAARLAEAGGLDMMVCLEPFGAPGLAVLPWSALDGDPADIREAAAEIPPETLACLIYTSGTGGAPRGVMLAHRAILSNCRGAFRAARGLGFGDETYLSFLPMSHSYEHTVGGFFMPSIGCEVVFSRGIEHLAADLAAIHPTVITVVPRILDVMRSRILAAVARQPAWRRWLFRLTVAGRAGVLGAPVRRQVRARFGGRLLVAISGGARLDPAIGTFFRDLGLTLVQGYGQTEAGPVVGVAMPSEPIGCVGYPLQGVELRFAEDGEILLRGGLLMSGYWNRPAETAAAIVDGWLHTGDTGALDAAGRLIVRDRKRDLIVLSGGENVSPARIEALLLREAAIVQAVVAGDGEASLHGFLVAAEGYDAAGVAAAVARVNGALSVPERVRRHRIVPAFTVENGLLTATQKVRRQTVIRAYAER